MKLILFALFLMAFRPTREFNCRRMDFFVPFVLGAVLGLMLLPILATGNFPGWMLFSFPIATGGVVATKARPWFKNVFGGKNNGKDDDR